MPLQLNRRPLGVDDVLGGKSWPTVQTQVADQVVVTYNATADYMAARRYGAVGNVIATGGTANSQVATLFNVPAGEAWYVENLGVISATTTPVGWVGSSMSLVVSEVGTGNLSLYAGAATRIFTLNGNHVAAQSIREGINGGFWLYPAAQIAVVINGSGLAALQVQGTWSGTRILL